MSNPSDERSAPQKKYAQDPRYEWVTLRQDRYGPAVSAEDP